jgi:ferredoxin-fold anticodon binding domain-containing protein
MNDDELKEASNAFVKAMNEIQEDQEKFWSSLSTEDQLKAFCCVVRRIYDGEIRNPRSYRGVLYDVFGFGPEAYAQAQQAGFLSLHNSIMSDEEFNELRKDL